MIYVINEIANEHGLSGLLLFIFFSIVILVLLWKSILWFTPKEREKRKLAAELKARRYRKMGWKMDDEKHTGHSDYHSHDHDYYDYSGDSGDSD